jgi:protein-tyrosine phosphatase
LPFQAGAWLSSRWFTRAGDWSTEVVPGVWIGRAPGAADWKILHAPAVLDLTAEFDAGSAAAARCYRSVPMLDLVAPTAAQLQRAVAALDALHAHAPVLVHCALGYSRSALVIAAWLLKRGVASTPEQAIAIVRKARPRMVLPDTYRRLLEGMQGG